MKRALQSSLLGLLMALSVPSWSDAYKIDTEGAHAFIQFRVKHLGFSWLYGRLNDFDGEFVYDPKDPQKNNVRINVDMSSIDTNHARRDKHLRSEDFLNVKKYPQAKFESTAYSQTGPEAGVIEGDLTLHGITNPIRINVVRMGMGPDPWGGYRAGFEGRAAIDPSKWGIDMKELGKASQMVELILSVEGVRQDNEKKGDGNSERAEEQ